jgi:hypothetical protein
MKYETPFDLPLEEYEGLIENGQYWDDSGDEANWLTMEQKLIRLAGFVQKGGDLARVINNYAEDRAEYKRQRIQFSVAAYILKLMAGDKYSIKMKDVPLVNRIRCLNRDELVELLTEELKRGVIKTEKYDKDYKVHDDWEILSDNDDFRINDEILDAIERNHWRKNPDESTTTYFYRAEHWWNHVNSLW